MIEFALKGKKKDINQISSTGVGVGNIEGFNRVLFTEYDSDLGQKLQNNYLKSKFECEMKLQEAREKGLNVNIYRMGNLSFHTGTGKFQSNIEENVGYLLIRAFMKLNIMPDVEYRNTDMTFIDYASKAVGLIFDRKNLKNETYHIYNSNYTGFKELWRYLQVYQPDLQLMSVEGMVETILKNYNNKELMPYIENILFHSDVIGEMNDTNIIKISEKTDVILGKMGFKWPRFKRKEFLKSIMYAIKVKFI